MGGPRGSVAAAHSVSPPPPRAYLIHARLVLPRSRRLATLSLLRHLLGEVLTTLDHLFLGGVLHVGREPPDLAERIDHGPEAIAPEHLHHRHRRLGAGLAGAVEDRGPVGHVALDRGGGG